MMHTKLYHCCMYPIIILILYTKGYLAQCDGTALTVDLDPFEPLIFKYPQTGTYNQNLNCKWLFRSTKVSTFLSQVTNSNVDCGDTLIIYNGNSTSSALESNGCSSSPGGTKTIKSSTQSDILLVFNTDDNTVSGTETGFDLRLISGYDMSNSSEACVTRTTLTATSNIQYLTSPNFPQKVEKNMNCSWVITTEEPSANISIEIRFQDLDTYNGNCYDYINIIDAGVERMWCTRTKFVVETMESTGNTITVNFISGTYGPYHGFALSYRQNISTVDNKTTSATSSTEPVTGEKTTEDQSTVATTTQSTAHQLTSTGQINQCNGDIQIISMEMFKPLTFKYPDNGTYDQNLNCKWLFSSAPGSVILFHVANSYVHCDDTLRTYDGNSTSSSVLLDNGCSNPPGGTKTPIVSTQNDILVYFTTDGTLTANTETGFDLPVISGIDMSNSGESCVSQTNLTATSHVQYLTSQNFPNKVVKNSKCTWVITAADSSANISIVLLFLDLDVYNGNCYDSLNIIDGGVKTQKCKRFSFPNETYTSESNTLTIQFTSGNFGPFHGFVLSYSQTDPADIATSADTTATSSAVTTDATVADKTSTSFTSTEIQTTTETYITTPATTQEADTSPTTTVSPTTTIPVSTATSTHTTSSPTLTTTTTTLSSTTTKADETLYNCAALTTKDFFAIAPFTPAVRIVLCIVLTADTTTATRSTEPVTGEKTTEDQSTVATTTQSTSQQLTTTGQINQCNGDIQTIAMEMFKPLTFKYPDNGTYDQNLNCKWLFSSAPGSVILFQVANSYVHCDDTLRTYDGNSTSSSVLLDNGCSNPPGGTKPPIVSTQNDILVYFTTDGTLTANTETGFDLPVISGIDMSNSGESCVSQTNLTATSHVQYLTSQNFPNKVVKNSKCTWVITAADSSANISIVLLFLDLDVYNGNCYDSLNIIDGGVKTQKCKRFSFPNGSYTSESNTVTIQFTSGNFGPFHGFVLSYSQTATYTSITTSIITEATMTTSTPATTTTMEQTTTDVSTLTSTTGDTTSVSSTMSTTEASTSTAEDTTSVSSTSVSSTMSTTEASTSTTEDTTSVSSTPVSLTLSTTDAITTTTEDTTSVSSTPLSLTLRTTEASTSTTEDTTSVSSTSVSSTVSTTDAITSTTEDTTSVSSTPVSLTLSTTEASTTTTEDTTSVSSTPVSFTLRTTEASTSTTEDTTSVSSTSVSSTVSTTDAIPSTTEDTTSLSSSVSTAEASTRTIEDTMSVSSTVSTAEARTSTTDHTTSVSSTLGTTEPRINTTGDTTSVSSTVRAPEASISTSEDTSTYTDTATTTGPNDGGEKKENSDKSVVIALVVIAIVFFLAFVLALIFIIIIMRHRTSSLLKTTHQEKELNDATTPSQIESSVYETSLNIQQDNNYENLDVHVYQYL